MAACSIAPTFFQQLQFHFTSQFFSFECLNILVCIFRHSVAIAYFSRRANDLNLQEIYILYSTVLTSFFVFEQYFLELALFWLIVEYFN